MKLINCLKTGDGISVLLFGCQVINLKVETEISYFHTTIKEPYQILYNTENPEQKFRIIVPDEAVELKRPVMLLGFEVDVAI